MARQINVFSPAEAAVYPLRVAEFLHAPGTRVTRGTAIVRLEGATRNIRLAAPFDAMIVRNATLSGTTLDGRTALVTLEVADADLPAQKPARPDQTSAPEPRDPAFGQANAGDRSGNVKAPRIGRRFATVAAVLAAAAFVWWATPATRIALVLTGGDMSLLARAIVLDATRIPERLFGDPVSPDGNRVSGFALAKTGKASLRCIGKHTYFLAGSLFTSGRPIRSEKDNGLATIDFDFSKGRACVRFGHIARRDDGSLHDDLGPADCVGYVQSQGAVYLKTAMTFSVDYTNDVRLRLSDMALSHEEGTVDEETRSEIVESNGYALTCNALER